jgi:hypothetical protein
VSETSERIDALLAERPEVIPEWYRTDEGVRAMMEELLFWRQQAHAYGLEAARERRAREVADNARNLELLAKVSRLELQLEVRAQEARGLSTRAIVRQLTDFYRDPWVPEYEIRGAYADLYENDTGVLAYVDDLLDE